MSLFFLTAHRIILENEIAALVMYANVIIVLFIDTCLSHYLNSKLYEVSLLQSIDL